MLVAANASRAERCRRIKERERKERREARGNAKEPPSRARDFIKIHEPYARLAPLRRGGL